MALSHGLSAAIMNPYSADMLKAYYSFCALNGMDENCLDYIKLAEENPQQTVTACVTATEGTREQFKSQLQRAIVKGLKEEASQLTSELVKTVEPLQVVQEEIIPALNIVGEGFENKTVYLPQLLMSAEAAKFAFEEIKKNVKHENAVTENRVVIATVKGDIHDIGKNIVKLLLENYGFYVVDLGRDVAPEDVLKTVRELKAPLVGLSALMTTTVPAMEETVRLIKAEAPWCKTVVGGAVLTRQLAENIGADKYAKDAMETVRYAQEIFKL